MRSSLLLFFALLFCVGTFACEPPKLACTLDRDCTGGQSCVNGQCKAVGDSCRPGDKKGCYTGPATTRGKGICRDGTLTCSSNGKWDTNCEGEIKPKAELCDGQDNNCDGKPDNLQTKPEVCDGVDNDCNGKIDENLQRKCYTGPAGTQGNSPCKGGIQACTSGEWPAACEGERTPRTEICNNKTDDDCDGKVDNVDIGEACRDLDKKGVCQKGTWSCGSDDKKTCISSVQPMTETCNGKDDDCDGKTDNQSGKTEPLSQVCPYTGPAGTEGIGTCKAGNRLCEGGKWSSTCKNQVVPVKENCNNLDDNCDGSIDEGLTKQNCYSGPTGTKGVGPCKGGTQVCNAGKWSPCKGEVSPKEELCNNGKDDDCNGKVDDVPDLGAFCLDPSRKGLCQRGVYTCQGQKRVCKQRIQPTTTEECNGNDEDCDGKIDNIKGTSDPLFRACYKGSAATRKQGDCKDGKQYCVRGRWSENCDGEVLPRAELCNKKDDDCDGTVDEGSACAKCVNGSTRPCFTGASILRGRGICRDGKELCVNKKWSGNCTGDTLPKAEICNNVDDNCDSITDNLKGTQKPLSKECYTPDPKTKNKGVCLSGFQECITGQWGTCKGEQKPQKEICDNQDNNCDGSVDEIPACQGKVRSLGEICSNASTSLKCETGYSCIQADENTPASYCYQKCKTASDCSKNKDGRTDCAMLSPTQGFCFARGEEGTACDISQSKFCKKGLFCDLNIRRCRRESEALPLGKCGGQTGLTCDPQHECRPQTPGSSYGFCVKKCTLNTECPSKLCIFYAAGKGTCTPLGTQKEDQVCGRGDRGTKVDPSRYCAKGLFCSRFVSINPDGVCLRAVPTCSSCGSGRFCLTVGTQGLKVCGKTCGTCASGQICTNVTQQNKICIPVVPPGGVPFAGTCGPHRLCQTGLFCLSSDPRKFTGFCSKLNCQTDADCPNIPPGATCKAVLPGGLKSCVYPCQNSNNCPTGLACATNLKYCLVP